ncbi:hypothetical protein BDQ17DRAFT_1356977 [Cyathus striatus]|nr:hypothetical protein BDQ17DRAFT_1356977 [Cyathus striatus]
MPLYHPPSAHKLKSIRSSVFARVEISRGDCHFDKLPTEILQEIFNCCFDWVDHRYCVVDAVVRYGRQKTITLSQICQRWRYVTLSMPQLWSYIILKNPSLVQLWLERSGSSPLYLDIVSERGRDVDSFSLAIKHVSRWKALATVVLYRHVLEGLENLQWKSSAYFRLLSIDGINIPLERKLSFTDAIFTFLSTSPNMRHLQWSGLCLPSFMDSNTWSRLTEIFLDGLYNVSPDDCVKCLSLCTSATDITFTSSERDNLTTPSDYHRVVSLPRLSRLTIALHADIGAILQFFSFPQLTELIINLTHGPYNYDALSRFYTQSNCPLRVLDLYLDNSHYKESVIGYLTQSWLVHIPEVTFYSYDVPESIKPELMSRADINPAIKSRLTVDKLSVRWKIPSCKIV